MYIQLAERRPKRRTKVQSYRRRSNTVRSHYRSLSETSPDAGNPYVFIPEGLAQQYGFPGAIKIREDLLDGMVPSEWRMLMAQIAAYQDSVQSGQMSEAHFMADRASRKAKREEKKKKKEENKTQKRQTKKEKKDAKTEIKKARAQAKREGRGADVLGSVIEGAKGMFGLTTDAGSTDDADLPPGDGGGSEDEPWYTTTGGMIGIAAGVLALAGGAYYISKRSA